MAIKKPSEKDLYCARCDAYPDLIVEERKVVRETRKWFEASKSYELLSSATYEDGVKKCGLCGSELVVDDTEEKEKTKDKFKSWEKLNMKESVVVITAYAISIGKPSTDTRSMEESEVEAYYSDNKEKFGFRFGR